MGLGTLPVPQYGKIGKAETLENASGLGNTIFRSSPESVLGYNSQPIVYIVKLYNGQK